MKKHVPLFLPMLFCTAAFGQIDWVYDNPGQHIYLDKLFKTKSNQYVLFQANEWEPSRHLTLLDSSGAVVKDGTIDGFLPGTSLSQFNDLIEMPDGSLVLTATIVAVDQGGTGNFNGAAIQLDSTGNMANYIFLNQFVEPIGTVLSDGSYILKEVNSNYITRLTNDGSTMWNVQLAGYTVTDMVATDSDSIMVAAVEGLIVLDKNGAVAGEYPGLSFKRIGVIGQGGLIGTREDSIFLVSPDYAILMGTGFSGDKIKDFAVSDDFIGVLTESEMVYRYDGMLTLLNNFQLEGSEEFNFIVNGAQGYIMGGQEQYAEGAFDGSTISSFLKEYSFEGDDYGLSNDVGVIAIETGTETVLVPQGSGFLVIFKDLEVTVKNFGNNIVNSLYLHSRQYRSHKFSGLSLQPGNEMVLTWEELDRFFSSYPAGQLIDLCIWTSHPDFRLDTDASNDKYCTDFLVGSQEVVSPIAFNIYPNPSFSQSILEYQLPPTKMGKVNIYDSLGRQVATYDVRGGDGSLILPALPKGLYFAVLSVEGQVVGQGKFVRL